MNAHETLEQELRRGLHEVADDFVPTPLPGDLWSRGRAPRPTSRMSLAVAAAVALLVLLGSVALVRPDVLVRPADAPRGGALPQEVWVPQVRELDDPPRPVDDVGPASVALPLDDGAVLLVSAKDARHHVRTLPDLDVPGMALPQVALSPDGRHLAHASFVPGAVRDEDMAGVAIVDLSTGDQTTTVLEAPDGAPLRVTRLQWSPDGSRVGWAALAYDPEGGNDERVWAGVASLDDELGGPWRLPSRSSLGVLAARPDGGLVVGDWRRLWQLDADTRPGPLREDEGQPYDAAETSGEESPTPLSTDLTTVALSGVQDDDGRAQTFDLDLDDPDLGLTGRPWDVSGDFATTPLGWTPDGALLATTLDEPVIQRSTDRGAPSDLIRIHGATGADFSVASALGDADPIAGPRPDWAPRSNWLWFVLGSAVVVVALWLFERRRRRTAADAAAATRPRSKASGWALAALISLGIASLPFIGAIRSWSTTTFVVGGVVVALLLTWIRLPGSTLAGSRRAGLRLLVVAGALAWATQPLWSSLGAPTSDEPALPAHAEWRWMRAGMDDGPAIAPVTDAAPGVTSMVFSGDEGVAILVDAHDGRHRPVLLPGFPQYYFERYAGIRAQLSPDGTQLAWPYIDAGDGMGGYYDSDTAGIAVADLVEGTMRRLPLVGRNDRPVRVLHLAWSPDGSRLAWFGDEAAEWGPEGMAFRGKVRVAGSTPLDELDGAFRVLDSAEGWYVGLAAADDGAAYIVSGRSLLTLPADPETTVSSRRVTGIALNWTSASLSPDGTSLAVGMNGGVEYTYGSGLRRLDLTDPTSQLELDPWNAPRDLDRVEVQGHTPRGDVMIMHARPMGSGRMTPAVLAVGARGAAELTELRGVDDATGVSAASALAASPPFDFAGPRWPLTTVRQVLIGVLVTGLVVQLVAFAPWRWWRRRNTRIT
ncbi:PD40 domain-containing protein [Nocardioides daphniae]|uniref:WD40 repeat domain-containing protein n=1 Tax=Nocardioides daphniae TaxID=402297 RepID=A0A4P7UIP1_9ACTN|nr:PD40 domain-containing protein [Nocardioides daphniae]QCC78379.1 hypothetical protein E2C04_16365 [Nocardioides daphniae]GGD13016.1 hypothetical protein GCM10007231_10070 [Nocardioides daphniae]